MDTSLYTDEDEDRSAQRLVRQALSFVVHAALALGSWLALMLVGYAVNPQVVPQAALLLADDRCPLDCEYAHQAQ